MDKKVTIVTHSGKFHADDVFAVATLSLLLLKENKEFQIVRSRHAEVISTGDYVVDVGGIYDEAKNLFDHHQEGGAGGRENGIPYSSFGLVWKKYGEGVSGNKEVGDKIDKMLVQPIDAHDNGIQFVETKIEGLYTYDIGHFFQALIPSWKEGLEHVDEIFIQAVSYAKILLSREVSRQKDSLEAREIVQKTYSESTDKRLIIFDRYYPLDDYMSEFKEVLFTVFPGNDGTWVLHTTRDNPEEFVSRKNLPESWAGKMNEELEKITGVPDSVFCHNKRFIAVAKTKEAILKLAEIALNS